MKKFVDKMKKFYHENRVFAILMIVAITCLAIILVLFLNYFFMGVNKNKYGNRLKVVEDIKISDDLKKEVVKELESNDIVKKATVTVQGRIIYVRITCENTTLVDGENQAILALDKFNDEIKNAYDIHFTLKQEAKNGIEGFVIMGAKNKGNINIIWNNNTPIPEVDENPNVDES